MTIDRRTVVLGVVAAGAVAAAVAVTVFRHTSKGNPKRLAVIAYIDRVNAIENAMHAPLTRVLLAYRDFTTTGGNRHAAGTELQTAALTLTRLGRKLAAVPAPDEARTLRKRLVSLVDSQAAITTEVQEMATFSPRFARVLVQARTANIRLGAALRAVPIPKPHRLKGSRKKVLAAQRAFRARANAAAASQAGAVDTYDDAVAGVLTQLGRLRPPRVFEPAYDAQIRAFRAVRASGAKLSAALRKTKRTDVSALGRRFQVSARIAQSTAAQRAEILAIKAYNARARAIATATSEVQAELRRLQRTLP